MFASVSSMPGIEKNNEVNQILPNVDVAILNLFDYVERMSGPCQKMIRVTACKSGGCSIDDI